jgi:hypothetical protein
MICWNKLMMRGLPGRRPAQPWRLPAVLEPMPELVGLKKDQPEKAARGDDFG